MTDAPEPAPRSNVKAFFYDSFATEWDSRMNMPELAGAGTGWFSRGLSHWGGRVTSLDVGPELMDQVRRKCDSRLVVGSVLDLPFPDASFDIVLCTEVIEHTTDPRGAVSEFCQVLRPASVVVLTVPNRAWHWAVRAANSLRVRPYRGYENWVGYGELASWARGQGLVVRRQFGFNLLPHTFFCRSSFDRLDTIAVLHPYMINIAVKASKQRRSRGTHPRPWRHRARACSARSRVKLICSSTIRT